MKKHDSRRPFSAFDKPAARGAPVAVGPCFICYFDRAAAYARERFGCDDVRPPGGIHDAVNDIRSRPHDSQHDYECDWQERFD